MIRSTRNEGIKTITRVVSGHRSESKEHVYGSDDGINAPAPASITEAQYDALTGNTYSPVHSNEFWDGTTITR